MNLANSNKGVNLGQLVTTAGIHHWMNETESPIRRQRVAHAIQRHSNADWGDVCDEDKATNNFALEHGERLLSSYSVDGRQIWIITEWDRSVTTVLFPEEY